MPYYLPRTWPVCETPCRPARKLLTSPVQGDAFYVVFSGAVSIYVEYEIAERGAEGAHARLLLLRERERAAAMSQSTAKETDGGAPAPGEALEAPRRDSRPRDDAAPGSISDAGGAGELTRENTQPAKATHQPSGAAQRRPSSANLAEAGVGAAVGRAEARRASSEVHRGAGGTEVRSSEEEKEREQVSGCEAIHPACNPF